MHQHAKDCDIKLNFWYTQIFLYKSQEKKKSTSFSFSHGVKLVSKNFRTLSYYYHKETLSETQDTGAAHS